MNKVRGLCLSLSIVLLVAKSNVFCMKEVSFEKRVENYVKYCLADIDPELPITYFCVCNKLLNINLGEKPGNGHSFFDSLFHLTSDHDLSEKQQIQIYNKIEKLVKELLDFNEGSLAIFSGRLDNISVDEKVLRAFIAKKILYKIDAFCEDLRVIVDDILVGFRIGSLKYDLLSNVSKNDFVGVFRWILRGDDVNCAYAHELGRVFKLVTPLHLALHMRGGDDSKSKNSISSLILQLLIVAGAFANGKTGDDQYLISLVLPKNDAVAIKILVTAGTQVPEADLYQLQDLGILPVDTAQIVRS